MKAIIIANGTYLKKELFNKIYDKKDFIICADGGLNYIDNLNIIPNLIVGDFDSVNKDILHKYNNVETVKYKPEKDYTDTELAIEKAIEFGFKEILLVCATGTRLDHTMANVLLIEKYIKETISIRLIDNNNYIQPLVQNKTINICKNCFVSIIPLTDYIQIDSLEGFKYPLLDRTVNRGSTLCISNEIVSETAEIKISHGIGLLIISND
ncbi:thiamine diphosphokinase [Sedimentibacter sp. zth1]|uniref:thiamine diphosphokinase n=1 Tax=Sedimentibacter sp. zth1 TaxID=2816908 RepID=UPI001A937594|nr:thiamine diphosphokinase [Sedimentibacter sp. zth1]QSX06854.1 thiamine diphosphokinase [Sedimentibacter sp. zth1]